MRLSTIIAFLLLPACTTPLYAEKGRVLGVGFDWGEQQDREAAAPAIARCVLAVPGSLQAKDPRVTFRTDVAEVCRVPGAPDAAACYLVDGLIVLPVKPEFPASLLCHEANHARLRDRGGLGDMDPKHLDPSWSAADRAQAPCS